MITPENGDGILITYQPRAGDCDVGAEHATDRCAVWRRRAHQVRWDGSRVLDLDRGRARAEMYRVVRQRDGGATGLRHADGQRGASD